MKADMLSETDKYINIYINKSYLYMLEWKYSVYKSKV